MTPPPNFETLSIIFPIFLCALVAPWNPSAKLRRFNDSWRLFVCLLLK